MAAIDLKVRAKKFIECLPPKHIKQLKSSILSLATDPYPQDAKKLQGYENYNRIDCGEYRIIYRYEQEKDVVVIVLVGKRNDDSIYRVAKRSLK